MVLSDLIAAARDSVSNLQQSEVTETPLLPYKDEVLGIVTTGLQTSSLRRPAFACLLGMVSTKNLLTDEELGFVVHKANEVLQGDTNENDAEMYARAVLICSQPDFESAAILLNW